MDTEKECADLIHM